MRLGSGAEQSYLLYIWLEFRPMHKIYLAPGILSKLYLNHSSQADSPAQRSLKFVSGVPTLCTSSSFLHGLACYSSCTAQAVSPVPVNPRVATHTGAEVQAVSAQARLSPHASSSPALLHPSSDLSVGMLSTDRTVYSRSSCMRTNNSVS